MSDPRPRVGATHLTDGSTRFCVWAPRPRTVELMIANQDPIALELLGNGYYETVVPKVTPGTRYAYRLDGRIDRPDPASRWQPEGIHLSSAVTSNDFAWTDSAWRGRAWDEFVIYEAHVGAFTPAGTFAAMIEHLDALVELGITALEVMPVAQFPGERNWGYDGVHLYAAQNTYGGPSGLKQLVDACHARGLAVILDVVYNHLGPEGNYLAEFGPYFTEKYRTSWGPAINYDGPDSRAVRDFFVGNAVYWIEEFHVDGLRLDATHAIHDGSDNHLLRELADAVRDCGHRLNRRVYTIAENNANDPKLTSPDGRGLDAQLLDDFQRSLHALASSERMGFYADFGKCSDFAKSYHSGFVLTGQPSIYRRGPWGTDASDVPADHYVVYAQSHDTVGNRPGSGRLGSLVDFESLKLAAAATILAPSIPFLFMGEEYNDPAPFWFFTSFLDPMLGEAVRRGRVRELSAFGLDLGRIDPQSLHSFVESKLTRSLSAVGDHAILRAYYRELLRLRRELPAVRQADRAQAKVEVDEDRKLTIANRIAESEEICLLLNFGNEPAVFSELPVDLAEWHPRLDSADARWRSSATETHSPSSQAQVAPRSAQLFSRLRSE